MSSKINGQFVLWLMGPTSSGKTTLANNLLSILRKKGLQTLHYDGDEVRGFFGSNLGFEPSDRLRIVKTLVHLSNKSLEAGVNVVVSALTANDDARNYVRDNTINLKTIYIQCSIKHCAQRDPKGLYTKANNGEIQTLIGLNTEYKEPESPDFVVNTEGKSIETSVKEIVTQLGDVGLIYDKKIAAKK